MLEEKISSQKDIELFLEECSKQRNEAAKENALDDINRV